MACEFVTGFREGPSYRVVACRKVQEACGYTNPCIPEPQCEACSKADDGASIISRIADKMLRQRIVIRGAMAGANALGLTLDEALVRFKSRHGANASEALVEAVERGSLSEAQGLALAQKHFDGE